MKADIDKFVADYRDDALFVAPSGTKTGKDGVRQAFQELLALVPDAKWGVPVIVIADDLLLIEWSARSAKSDITAGVGTFVFRDGLIRAQMVRYTVQPH